MASSIQKTRRSTPTHERSLNYRVGKAVHRLRQLRGIGQQELAEACGITQPAVSQIEAGKRLNLNTLEKISEALGCELSELIKLAQLHSAENEMYLQEAEAALEEAQASGTVPWKEVKARLGL